MKTNKLSFSLDIMIHVLILFTFLTVLFFSYVIKLEKDNLNNVTTSTVQDNTKKALDLLKKSDLKVDWKKLDSISDNLISASKVEDPSIIKNNNTLFRNSIICIVVVFVLIVALALVGKFILKLDLNLKSILITNLVVFSITGLIEFLFFQFVATKYIPVTPDTIVNEASDEILKKI